MTRPLKTLFVIADASRARLVLRSADSHDFKTERELAAAPSPPGHPTGADFQGSAGQRFTVQPRISTAQRRRKHFADEIASVIEQQTGVNDVDRVAIVAPARTLQAITERLSPAAKRRLCGTVSKDLTKTANHELGRWLTPLEFD